MGNPDIGLSSSDRVATQSALSMFSKSGRLRAVAGLARGGKSRQIIPIVGDSNTSGYMSETTTSSLKAHSIPAFLASILNATLPTMSEATFGNGNYSAAAFATYDPTVVVPTDWQGASVATLGGQAFNNITGTTGAWRKTPLAAWNTVDVYTRGSAGTSFTISNGTTTQTVNVAANTLLKTTYSTGSAAAVQTISIACVSGGQLLIGVDPYDSASPKLSIVNCGGNGDTAARLSETNVYSVIPVLKALAPALVGFQFGLNDWNTGRSATAFQADLQNGVGLVKSTMDPFIIVPSPPGGSPGTAGGSSWADFVNAMYAVADANGSPIVDFTARNTDYATMQALGLRTQELHPNTPGYADCAAAIAAPIRAVIA